jgi:hypothetical protein
MKKIVLVIGILAVVAFGAGLYSINRNDSRNKNESVNSSDNPPPQQIKVEDKNDSTSTRQTREEAIGQAKEYQPEEDCIAALTPAVHKDTGAKYTFPSGCIAPGWEPENQG